jgi:4-hydroxybenzoate polyprenyltransferase
MVNKTFIRRFITLLRVWDWWSQVDIVFVSALIVLLFTPDPTRYLSSLIVLGAYMAFLGGYGYVLNSYTDRKQDTEAGKHIEVAYFSSAQHLTIILFFALGALGVPFIYDNNTVRVLGVITFILATFYSAEPFRFKERGILGPLAGTMPQRPLTFLFFAFSIGGPSLLAWFIFGWLVLSGFVVELNHQLIDYSIDKKTHVNTWAQMIGFARLRSTIILIQGITFAYMLIPVFLFGALNGLTISLILFIFYKDVLMYLKTGLKIKSA